MELMTVNEVAARLDMSIWTVYRMIEDGKIKAFRPGKRTFRISKRDFEEYIQEQLNANNV